MDSTVKKTCMPLVAGILDILSAIFILSILFLFAIGGMIIEPVKAGTFQFDWSLLLLVIPAITIAILAIVGGVFAIQRRRWGWSLAGSIAATLLPIPFGIAAIILLVLSKNDFR